MTVSQPYPDDRQASRRNRVDWLVTVRGASAVQTFRFADEEAAWTFYGEQQDETPDDERASRRKASPDESVSSTTERVPHERARGSPQGEAVRCALAR